MISFTVAVKDGVHLRGETIEVEELGPQELARCTELAHEMLAHIERIARRDVSRREARTKDL